MPEIVWLILLAVFLVIEAATLDLLTIWFAGGALVTFFVALATDNLVIQMVVFFAISLILLFFTRPMAVRYYNGKRTKTNVEKLVGEQCKVTEAIDNFNEKGTVLLNGLEWTARSKDGSPIAEGARVQVCAVNGVKVIVEEVKNEN
ncbi:MAG: NfeD family protein [Lachnospiraceae bacterium]|nr:NfeD family protein [Lachnospiraceae bacterium]